MPINQCIDRPIFARSLLATARATDAVSGIEQARSLEPNALKKDCIAAQSNAEEKSCEQTP
jgi:hypothetical protein